MNQVTLSAEGRASTRKWAEASPSARRLGMAIMAWDKRVYGNFRGAQADNGFMDSG